MLSIKAGSEHWCLIRLFLFNPSERKSVYFLKVDKLLLFISLNRFTPLPPELNAFCADESNE